MIGNKYNLEELSIREIGIWPKEYQAMILIVFSLLISFFSYTLILKSNYQKYNNLNNQINTCIEDFKENYKQSVNLDLYNAQMVEIQKKLKYVLKKLPSKDELPILLEDITQQAIAAGLNFELIKPEEPIDKGFYFEQPISIILTGKYHQFGKFSAGISGLSRIVTLHDFSINNKINNRASKPTSATTLTISTTAKTYWYIDKEQL